MWLLCWWMVGCLQPWFGVVALAHRRKRAALSGVLRELTMQQGFMLAQIVVEIPARDSTAEGAAGGEWVGMRVVARGWWWWRRR
jgi:hypothetical protein